MKKEEKSKEKRRLLFSLFFFLFSLVISLSACAQRSAQGNGNGYAEDAIRLEQALACFNSYVGVSFTIPRGWWLYDLNTANFSPDPADTADTSTFDIIYEDDSIRMDLISFANLRSFKRNKYLGFEMSMEYREEYSGETPERGEYWGHFEGFIPENPQDTLIDSGVITLGGASFEKHIYEAAQPNNLRIITLGTSLKTGYFLNIQAVYWAENKNAENLIIELINNALILD
jgi:hypothetical protein